MKRLQRIFIHMTFGFVITMLMVCGAGYTVNAANAGVTDLQANITYKSFDLDGDADCQPKRPPVPYSAATL